MTSNNLVTSRHQRIKTEEDKIALIEALKHDHPRNVADRFGLRPDSIKPYIRKAIETMRNELQDQGFSNMEIEERINRIFYRDGVQMKTIVYGGRR